MPPSTLSDSDLHLPIHARTLGFLLREVYGQLQERVYQAAAAAGHPHLRAAHSPVLRHLPREGGRVADLARATGLAKQSVTYVVEDLIALGYLLADPDPRDGRARRLSYTERGHKLLDTLLQASQDAEDALGGSIGKDRLRLLRETLESILGTPRAASRPKGATRTAGPRHRRVTAPGDV